MVAAGSRRSKNRTYNLPQTIHPVLCGLHSRETTNEWTVNRFRISPLFMFFSCGGCALSLSVTCFAAPLKNAVKSRHGWSNDDRNMLFSFVRDKPRIVQGPVFSSTNLIARTVFAALVVELSERPIGHELGGVGLLRRIQGQDVS